MHSTATITSNTSRFRTFVRLVAGGAVLLYAALGYSGIKAKPLGFELPAPQRIQLVAADEEQKNYPLDGLISDLEDDFNNSAEYLHVSPRIRKVKCETDIICEYRGSGGDIRVLAASKQGTGGNTDNVTMVFSGNKKKVAEYLVYVGVLVSTYAPVLSGPERAQVINMIINGSKKPDMKNEIELDGVRFTMQAGQGLGIWLFLADARNAEKDKQ